MVAVAAIDDLFRQKSLQEIHGVLRQTRQQIEHKKQELRELVGDHYRSVLESSDHIRAMSDCVLKVSAGAQQVEDLVASMRELAASPPSSKAAPRIGSSVEEAAEAAEVSREHNLGLRVLMLLDIPEAVRGHLGDHMFARAAKLALVEAERLRREVQYLLTSSGSHARVAGFDLQSVVRQQDVTLQGIPKQVAAACVNAFCTTTLTPSAAAEAFAVHLLLDPEEPDKLLKCFMDRRKELLSSAFRQKPGSGAETERLEHSAAQLASAAMAFEGTILLACGLCAAGPRGTPPRLLASALAKMQDGAGEEADEEEERAAIEGRKPGTEGGHASLRRRVEALLASPQSAGTLSSELARVGSALIQEWAPEDPGSRVGLAAGFDALLMELGTGSCAHLGELAKRCTERVLSYRRALTSGLGLGSELEDWRAAWRVSCTSFCPGRAAPDDALTVLAERIESCCAEVVQRKVFELHLVLVQQHEEMPSTPSDTGEGREDESETTSRRKEEISELRRQCRVRVLQFDQQVGEVLDDAGRAFGGEPTTAVTAALLAALEEQLRVSCEAVDLPTVTPAWPRDGAPVQTSGRSWPLLRRAARACVAFESLQAVVSGTGEAPTKLSALLRSATSSGDSGLSSSANAIAATVKQKGEHAYMVWARLAASPSSDLTDMAAFWQLGEDEVAPACGWGNAKFESQGEVSTGAAEALGVPADGARAVPVPVQASAFVLERLLLGSRRASELGGRGPAALAAAAALKVALSEAFLAAYEAEMPVDMPRLKRSGMAHLLQWLFDLNFLRIALSAGLGQGGAAYDALQDQLMKAEALTLSDPVDRLLYQEVLKSSVKGFTQSTKELLVPFFLFNPLYNFLQSPSGLQSPAGGAGRESEGFEVQAAIGPPLRTVLPRFPSLPVAMAPSSLSTSMGDMDTRLGEQGRGPGGSGSVSSLMQQVGSGLGSLVGGKAWTPLASNWR